jgi:hypothetical protein
VHGRAGGLERSTCRFAVHLAERPRRQEQVGVGTPAEECRPHGEHPRLRARLVHAQVEGRAHEDVPEAIDRHVRGAVAAKERPERLAIMRSRTSHARGHEREAQAVPERQVPVREERRQAGLDLGDGAVFPDDGQHERLPPNRASLADPLEEAEVLREAAERNVLPVVRSGLRIAFAPRQGVHRAAEPRASFVEHHLVALLDKLERCAETRETPSDDGDSHRRSPAPTMRSFVSGESRTEPSKTSNPRASIRSSVAR